MLTIRFRGFEPDGYDEAARAVRRVVLNRMRPTSRILMERLKRDTPVKSGKLRASTKRDIDLGPNTIITLIQDAPTADGFPYGWYVRNGTDPHEIRPKRAQALRFEINGEVVFAKRVNHPGTSPNPYHGRTLSFGEKLMMATMTKIEEDLMEIVNS